MASYIFNTIKPEDGPLSGFFCARTIRPFRESMDSEVLKKCFGLLGIAFLRRIVWLAQVLFAGGLYFSKNRIRIYLGRLL